ncbi:adenosylcobalamin-dependent ribonucleoside-triphosphate reductase [Planktosalinus lacus]|uniref:Adenosylcobalamin-dependent ribonucleoside-triphosphate reductase n=2 Tax=Planktosalinus lacus TaxID=1526573 RepID=A0A8J2V7P1_9FLAO|nr:adenosylcobalamin-dependent ribonucleoside-triphosphate reductase [Planktosalinus lacus]
MEMNQEILSDIVVHMKYARYLPEQNRREVWQEICDRYENMMLEKYPRLTTQIIEHMIRVRDKKVLPSMRAMQFAGPAINRNHSRIYNCAYLPVDDIYAFSETMFLLLGGTGVGYSVQKHHVANLPPIKKGNKRRKFLVGDSLEGWADAVKVLLKYYFGIHESKPDFDFSDIRPKGSRLVTAGGKAPGPEPLKICIAHLSAILDRKQDGEQLTPLECHDMMCHIANAVLAGGIRRSAMIALFSHDDEDMLTCKFGPWWELNEQRGRANNSAVLHRENITEREFFDLWTKIELSGSGEPGFYFTNNIDWGTNPCCEIALRPFQFCNLCEVNVSNIKSQQDLNERVATAAFLGTLQAGFTNFHYLREKWKTHTEKDALIGVGMTGIASGKLDTLNLDEAARVVKKVNEEVAIQIDIHIAARTTTIKPSGTTSLVLGTSSGIHAWHNKYYIRRIRIGKDEALCRYLTEHHPELIEADLLNSKQMIVCIPQNAPMGAITRHEDTMDLLKRIAKFNEQWIKKGYRNGENDNNVSATVSIKPDEWGKVGEWMWHNKSSYNGLSVLPFDNGNYQQAPFTDITKEAFEKMESKLHTIDLRNVMEFEDDTDLKAEAACAGGGCAVV